MSTLLPEKMFRNDNLSLSRQDRGNQSFFMLFKISTYTERQPSGNTLQIVAFQWIEVAQPCSTYLLLDHLLTECVFKMRFSMALMPSGLFTVEFLVTVNFEWKNSS